MPNPHGTPIWYELITPDPDGAKLFYDDVVGWTVHPPLPGPVEYRMVGGPNGFVAGVLKLTEEMKGEGMNPAWLPYFGVDDVDRSAEQAKGLGARIIVPPMDIPGVGRFSFLIDPQGALFYMMRGASDQSSTVFTRSVPGLCSWNELCTTDIAGGLSFYGALFGFENRETMNMGPMGGYHFLDLGEVRLGAAAEVKGQPPHWNSYFYVADVEAAAAKVVSGGGTVTVGPHDVPSGETIVQGLDPQGASFALVGPGKG